MENSVASAFATRLGAVPTSSGGAHGPRPDLRYAACPRSTGSIAAAVRAAVPLPATARARQPAPQPCPCVRARGAVSAPGARSAGTEATCTARAPPPWRTRSPPARPSARSPLVAGRDPEVRPARAPGATASHALADAPPRRAPGVSSTARRPAPSENAPHAARLQLWHPIGLYRLRDHPLPQRLPVDRLELRPYQRRPLRQPLIPLRLLPREASAPQAIG
jgi:hypothetical protein